MMYRFFDNPKTLKQLQLYISQINLSDDDDDEDEDNDDNYEDEDDEEVKSTHAEYHLKELRKPKTLCM